MYPVPLWAPYSDRDTHKQGFVQRRTTKIVMGLATTTQLTREVGTVCPRDFERAQMTTFKYLEKSFSGWPPSIIIS